MSRDQLGFSITPKMSRIMEANGHYAAIMRADKKKEDNGGLPSGVPIPCLPVDYLKERPSFWIGGSYVCPVSPDWGLWFNWQMNRRDMSILTSVKGMNPITGQRISGLGLEQYKEQCPVHKIPLKHGKFCSECNFKWPDQNYIADPTPFYLDGFRSEDGVVRQFYFTEDMAKSVPELMLGFNETIPAFGFCFYQLKNNPWTYESDNNLRDTIPEDWVFRTKSESDLATYISSATTRHKLAKGSGSGMSGITGICGIGGSDIIYTSSLAFHRDSESGKARTWDVSEPSCSIGSSAVYRCSTSETMSVSNSVDSLKLGHAMVDSVDGMNFMEPLTERARMRSAEVGVAAGAKIEQKFDRDAHSIDEWQDKPAGVIRVYFVFQEEFERYVEAGLNDLSGYKEGYLNGIPVGVSNE